MNMLVHKKLLHHINLSTSGSVISPSSKSCLNVCFVITLIPDHSKLHQYLAGFEWTFPTPKMINC